MFSITVGYCSQEFMNGHNILTFVLNNVDNFLCVNMSTAEKLTYEIECLPDISGRDILDSFHEPAIPFYGSLHRLYYRR